MAVTQYFQLLLLLAAVLVVPTTLMVHLAVLAAVLVGLVQELKAVVLEQPTKVLQVELTLLVIAHLAQVAAVVLA
jgi:hypothetical protein